MRVFRRDPPRLSHMPRTTRSISAAEARAARWRGYAGLGRDTEPGPDMAREPAAERRGGIDRQGPHRRKEQRRAAGLDPVAPAERGDRCVSRSVFGAASDRRGRRAPSFFFLPLPRQRGRGKGEGVSATEFSPDAAERRRFGFSWLHGPSPSLSPGRRGRGERGGDIGGDGTTAHPRTPATSCITAAESRQRISTRVPRSPRVSVREAHPVLRGRHQTGTGARRRLPQPGNLGLGKRVMIRKGMGRDQRGADARRLAKNFPGRPMPANATSGAPARPCRRWAPNRRGRSAARLADSVGSPLRSARLRRRGRARGDRLSQRPGRDHPAVAKAVFGIDDDQREMLVDRRVLKAVIEQDGVGPARDRARTPAARSRATQHGAQAAINSASSPTRSASCSAGSTASARRGGRHSPGDDVNIAAGRGDRSRKRQHDRGLSRAPATRLPTQITGTGAR